MVKVPGSGADGPGVETRSIPTGDGTLPFPHWRGLLTASVLVGVLVMVISLLFEHPEPERALGAGACLAVATACLMLSLASVGNQRSGLSALVVLYVVAALVVLAIGLVAVSLPGGGSVFLAAVLVPVAVVSAETFRSGRWALALWVVVVSISVIVINGSHPDSMAAQALVVSLTVAGVTWSVGWLAESAREEAALRHAIAGLNGTLDSALLDAPLHAGEATDSVLTHSLSHVAHALSARRVSVFSRNGAFGPIVGRATWSSEGGPAGKRPGHHAVERSSPLPPSGSTAEPILVEALRSGRIVATGANIVLPVGCSDHGDLVMLIDLIPGPPSRFLRRSETAEVLASVLCGAVVRVNRNTGTGVADQTDQLTGLATREVLSERIQIEMDRSLRSDEPLSIALVDLDHFSDYNTAHGRAAGDAVLRSIAAVIVSNLRRTDAVVRFGGEQFCVLFPATDIEGSHHILDQLRTGGRDTWSHFGVTMSVGLTAWDRMEDTDSIINRAGEALRRAKDTGRDRVVSIELATGT